MKKSLVLSLLALSTLANTQFESKVKNNLAIGRAQFECSLEGRDLNEILEDTQFIQSANIDCLDSISEAIEKIDNDGPNNLREAEFLIRAKLAIEKNDPSIIDLNILTPERATKKVYTLLENFKKINKVHVSEEDQIDPFLKELYDLMSDAGELFAVDKEEFGGIREVAIQVRDKVSKKIDSIIYQDSDTRRVEVDNDFFKRALTAIEKNDASILNLKILTPERAKKKTIEILEEFERADKNDYAKMSAILDKTNNTWPLLKKDQEVLKSVLISIRNKASKHMDQILYR